MPVASSTRVHPIIVCSCAAEFADLSAEEIALLQELLHRVLDNIATHEQEDGVGHGAPIAP
jgi:hypothetical protein